MNHWAQDAVFYHMYPLGLCGAPQVNDFHSAPVPRLEKIHGWLDHITGLGATAVYLGPVFESSSHGYDTADYYRVDRRLGTNETLAALVRAMHDRGLRVVLDGVFNHVGRDFWAFRELREHGADARTCGWFAGLRFDRGNRSGDPFSYDTWAGHESLVKLNLANPDVRTHLLQAVEHWIDEFGIDGLRLDAADVIDLEFLHSLANTCRSRKPDFWLMGEVVKGDYRRWANPETLESVTNYELYKGLYSSFNDRNFFEIAHTLNRQSGPYGLYNGLDFYNFTDNHDVSRVASLLKQKAHLYPLYALLFTIPGIPSVYYGSEFGLPGISQNGSDVQLRPELDLAALAARPPEPGLLPALRSFARLHRDLEPLRRGSYQQVLIAPEQFAFQREYEGRKILVLINASGQPARMDLVLSGWPDGRLDDRLNPGEGCTIIGSKASVVIPPCWARVLTAPA